MVKEGDYITFTGKSMKGGLGPYYEGKTVKVTRLEEAERGTKMWYVRPADHPTRPGSSAWIYTSNVRAYSVDDDIPEGVWS